MIKLTIHQCYSLFCVYVCVCVHVPVCVCVCVCVCVQVYDIKSQNSSLV